jgi:hypothetical protein
MTITAESIIRACIAPARARHAPASFAIYCRTGEHVRCAMVCACACHQIPRGTTWDALSTDEQTLALVEGGEG